MIKYVRFKYYRDYKDRPALMDFKDGSTKVFNSRKIAFEFRNILRRRLRENQLEDITLDNLPEWLVRKAQEMGEDYKPTFLNPCIKNKVLPKAS